MTYLSANFNFDFIFRLAMDSKYDVIEQNTIPTTFNMGDLVWTRWHGTIWLSVICPAFGSDEDSNDKYTEVRCPRESKKRYFRYYHIQRLGHTFEAAWRSEFKLDRINQENLPFEFDLRDREDRIAMDDYKMFVEKTNQERVEICKIRAETFEFFKTLDDAVGTDFLDLKMENIGLNFQLKRVKALWRKCLMP